jgi:hypothetical protein
VLVQESTGRSCGYLLGRPAGRLLFGTAWRTIDSIKTRLHTASYSPPLQTCFPQVIRTIITTSWTLPYIVQHFKDTYVVLTFRMWQYTKTYFNISRHNKPGITVDRCVCARARARACVCVCVCVGARNICIPIFLNYFRIIHHTSLWFSFTPKNTYKLNVHLCVCLFT